MNTIQSLKYERASKCEVGLYRTTRTRLMRAPQFLLAAALMLFASCQTVPITGRYAFNGFSIEQDKEMGAAAYDDMMSQEKLLTSGPEFELVNRAMNRLVAASTEYDPGFDWEVSVIDNPEVVNAFALPGGKMAVYTGIIPVAQSETGLAVVMGHEIGHVIGRHGTQRVSSSGAVDVVLDLLLEGDAHAIAGKLTGVLQLGYGRSQELEADHIGLILMGKAGYDPREAESFWQRMAAISGEAPTEWLSTHPSNSRRIDQIREKLPEAMALFHATNSQ